MAGMVPSHRAASPPTVFGEQVASKDGLAWLDLVCTDLEGAGYAVAPFDICAAGIGAPNIRQRLWFVANAQGGRGGAGLRGNDEAGSRRTISPDNIAVCGLANPDQCQSRERGGTSGEEGARVQRGTSADGCGVLGIERPGPVNGLWRAADWLLCRDGKWRPVEPGTFPLAHGIPNRVGRLRAYGNAINPYLAAEFIKAYMQGQRIEGSCL